LKIGEDHLVRGKRHWSNKISSLFKYQIV